MVLWLHEKKDEHNEMKGLTDYKFYCFNGEPKCLYVSKGLENHETAQISFLNVNWSFADFNRSDYKPFDKIPEKPQHYENMLEIARHLSKGIPFVRVDLYEIRNRIYFSELTFQPSAGMMPFNPEEWDYILGEWIKLPPFI